MQLILNGSAQEFSALGAEATLAELIEQLALKGDRVAVELNGEIVPRAGWSTAALKSGDKLEVVHFVGGGAR